MSKASDQVMSQVVEENAPEELTNGDLENANGGVSLPPIYTTPGGPGGPISIPVESV